MGCRLLKGAACVVAVGLAASGHTRALAAEVSSARVATQPGAAAFSAGSDQALLDRYCVGCHNRQARTAGLALDAMDFARIGDNAEIWEKVVRKLRGGLMPPPGRPRPDEAVNQAFVTRLESQLDRAAAANANVGRTETFHRLNRAEYRNAVRDVLGIDIDVTSLLPADDASYGFDNVAGSLKVNQSLMERYLSAALKISRIAVGSPLPAPAVDEFTVSDATRQDQQGEEMPVGTRGGKRIRYYFPQDGEYVFKIKLACGPPSGIGRCDGAGGFDDLHQLELAVGGERVNVWALEPRVTTAFNEAGWQVRAPIKAGPRDVTVGFPKPSDIDETEWLRQRFMRPIYISNNIGLQAAAIYQPAVAAVTISGPYDAHGPGDTPSRRRIFVCHPTNRLEEDRCARTIVSALARRAYRRPVTAADVKRLLAFYTSSREEGAAFEGGVEMAIRRLLVTPEFLFRIERDPMNVGPDVNYRLTGLELAARLSFFLWSTIPDDELLELAARGKLSDRAVLDRQVRRMLGDSRSRALVSNFVGQWLQLRNLEAKRPSEQLFPNFDDSLRDAFRRETELFFESVIRDDRSVMELLTADYTYVKERLALHYGIPHVKGSHFRRVALPDERRRGILGHGSILLITSHAIRTSPVLRGKWILTNILGAPPPDPPANVPPLKEKQAGERKAVPMRELMAQHRNNAVCAACHSMIDPAGFALENFDAVGRWRDREDLSNPIDASGALPDGTKFDGVVDFRKALVSQPERFVTTITEKLLTYALGRGLAHYDAPAVRTIRNEAKGQDYRFSSLILGVVNSQPFQMRRSAPSSGVPASR